MSQLGVGYGQFAGQPWVEAIPQPWEPQPYSPFEYRPRWDPGITIEPGHYAIDQPGWSGDPGIYVDPQPGWGGDPGIYAEPQPGWGGDPGIYAEPQPGWPGGPAVDAGAAPQPQPDAVEAVDRIASLDTGDHVAHGAKSLVVPGIVSGALVGAIAASAAPTAKAGVFVARAAGSAVGSIVGGAAMGLLVAASSPKDGDRLSARYAVAGGLLGGASGLIAPAHVRGVSIAIGALGNAALGYFVGRNLEHKVAAEAATEQQAAAAEAAADAPAVFA